MALDGKTPSEVARIKVGGDNKWMTHSERKAKLFETIILFRE